MIVFGKIKIFVLIIVLILSKVKLSGLSVCFKCVLLFLLCIKFFIGFFLNNEFILFFIFL